MSESTTSTDKVRIRALMFGCGNMGQALISGWMKADGASFTVVDPAEPDVGHGVDVVTSADSVQGPFDLVVIAVKPQLIPTVVEQADHLIEQADLILSIAAGTSIKTLENHLGHRPIVRMMPNMPASVRMGLSGLYANDKCMLQHKSMIEKLATENGEFLWLDEEDKIDKFTAVAGSGPGYVFEILRVFTLSAMKQGFSEEDARKLAIGTVLGSAKMADDSDKTLEDLRNSVTSKNGTTQAGLEQLMADGKLEDLLTRTVQAAYDRAVELR